MYRIAIVDDDYMVRESTKAVIERNFKEENFQVECFSTFSQLQSELSQELFTVYILDIELPDGNGLELAKEIRKIQERAYIVFLTAYEKYALFGYEVRAFHYIIKENMEKKLVQTKGQYLVKRAGVFEKVALREICYIYKEQKNSIFVTLQGKKANRESLKEVAGKLPKEQFVMAERGYIVNLLHVERLEKGMLTMDNGDLIKVGRGHNREIMQKMSEYMERGWR
jgi:DNA-binding LytR/AlgR family response regulator